MAHQEYPEPWRAVERSRLNVEAQDSTKAAAFDLRQLWEGLCSGKYRFVDAAYTDDEYAASFIEVDEAARETRLTERKIRILERVLQESLQEVAVAEDLSLSTVSELTSHALDAMGFENTVSRVHPIAVLAVEAKKTGFQLPAIKCPDDRKPRRFWVRIKRIEHLVRDRLTAAEYDVLKLLVERWSHDQISHQRQASRRTVANQMTSIFRKLGAGRGTEVLPLLLREAKRTAQRRMDATAGALTVEQLTATSLQERLLAIEAKLDRLLSLPMNGAARKRRGQ